jgi:peptidoglycan/LPS O-acetylase OafA/YrhL
MRSRHGLDLTYHNGIWRGMSAFAVGVGLSVLCRAVKKGSSRLPAIVFSAFQLAVVGWLFYAIWFTGWSHSHRDILTVLPMFALVFALSFDRGLVAELLKTRVPLKLGEWSYAIYIGQTFWLQLLRFSEQRIFPAPEALVLGHRWIDLVWWAEPIALVAVCVAWGACLTALIERPASDLLQRRLTSSRAPGVVKSA